MTGARTMSLRLPALALVSSPEQFADFIRRDSEKWSKVLREADIRID